MEKRKKFGFEAGDEAPSRPRQVLGCILHDSGPIMKSRERVSERHIEQTVLLNIGWMYLLLSHPPLSHVNLKLRINCHLPDLVIALLRKSI